MTPRKSILQKWSELDDSDRNLTPRFWSETFCILARMRRVLRTMWQMLSENVILHTMAPGSQKSTGTQCKPIRRAFWSLFSCSATIFPGGDAVLEGKSEVARAWGKIFWKKYFVRNGVISCPDTESVVKSAQKEKSCPNMASFGQGNVFENCCLKMAFCTQ